MARMAPTTAKVGTNAHASQSASKYIGTGLMAKAARAPTSDARVTGATRPLPLKLVRPWIRSNECPHAAGRQSPWAGSISCAGLVIGPFPE